MPKFETWSEELRILAAEARFKLTEDDLIYYLYFAKGFSAKETVDDIKNSHETNRKVRREILSKLLN